MSLLRRAFERRTAGDPYAPWGDATPPSPTMLGQSSFSGSPYMSEQGALAIAATYACMRIITDTVATAPLYAYRGFDDAKSKVAAAQTPLLVQPFADISRMDWMVQATLSLGLRGNFYGQIVERDARLYPTQIMPVHPDRATVRRNTDGEVEYRFNGQLVPLKDVFHIRYQSTPGALVGINPIQTLKTTFGLARGADAYGEAFYRNSAYPGGVIEVPGELDETETLSLAHAWKQGHQGAGMSSLPAVLTGGARWQQVTLTAEDAQFIATRQFSVYEIAMAFGVPPHWLGQQDRSPTATGIEDQVRMFNNITANGYLKRFEEALSAPAISPRGQYVEFNLDERLKGDMLTRYQTYTLARNASLLTPDEIRAKEGLAPLPNGLGANVLFPMNMTALGADGKPVVEPPKPVQTGGEPQPPTGLDNPPKKNPPKGQDKTK